MILLYACVIIVLVVLYYIPIFRAKIMGIQAVATGYQTYIFDRESSKYLMSAGKFLIKTGPKKLKQIDFDHVSRELDKKYDKIRKYQFVYVLAVVSFVFWALRRQSIDAMTMRNSVMNPKKWLTDKYGFIVEKEEGPELVKKKLDAYKKSKNLPVNLAARLFPKESPERLVILKGDRNYDIIEITPDFMKNNNRDGANL